MMSGRSNRMLTFRPLRPRYAMPEGNITVLERLRGSLRKSWRRSHLNRRWNKVTPWAPIGKIKKLWFCQSMGQKSQS